MLIVSFIPLALAALTPAMLAAVIFLLSLDRGLWRAGMFMAGRLLTYTGWSLALFFFTDRIFDLIPGSHADFALLLKVILGLLLMGMAVKIALGGDDPDALPAKIIDIFNDLSFLQLFGLGILVSVFQVRHIVLLFVGVTEIIIAELSTAATIVAAGVLVIMINASQLILIGIYLVLSDRADTFIKTIDIWLTQNTRWVAAGIGLVGIFLLGDGLRTLGVWG